jgi:hypothetical protein
MPSPSFRKALRLGCPSSERRARPVWPARSRLARTGTQASGRDGAQRLPRRTPSRAAGLRGLAWPPGPRTRGQLERRHRAAQKPAVIPDREGLPRVQGERWAEGLRWAATTWDQAPLPTRRPGDPTPRTARRAPASCEARSFAQRAYRGRAGRGAERSPPRGDKPSETGRSSSCWSAPAHARATSPSPRSHASRRRRPSLGRARPRPTRFPGGTPTRTTARVRDAPHRVTAKATDALDPKNVRPTQHPYGTAPASEHADTRSGIADLKNGDSPRRLQGRPTRTSNLGLALRQRRRTRTLRDQAVAPTRKALELDSRERSRLRPRFVGWRTSTSLVGRCGFPASTGRSRLEPGRPPTRTTGFAWGPTSTSSLQEGPGAGRGLTRTRPRRRSRQRHQAGLANIDAGQKGDGRAWQDGPIRAT